jgi:hypothetical protein
VDAADGGQVSAAIVLPDAALAQQVLDEARARREAKARGEPQTEPYHPSRDPLFPQYARNVTSHAETGPGSIGYTPPRDPSVRDLEARLAEAIRRYGWALQHGTPAEQRAHKRLREGIAASLVDARQPEADRVAASKTPEAVAAREQVFQQAQAQADREAEDERQIVLAGEMMGKALCAFDEAADAGWLPGRQQPIEQKDVPGWVVRTDNVRKRIALVALEYFTTHRLSAEVPAKLPSLADRLRGLAGAAELAAPIPNYDFSHIQSK